VDTKRRNATAQMVLAALVTRSDRDGLMLTGHYAAQTAMGWANDLEDEIEQQTKLEMAAKGWDIIDE
jgi:hypothetical protein